MLFTKMNGLGNDFVMVDGIGHKLSSDLAELSKSVCHRKLGIGADGLIILTPSAIADFGFKIYNADGSIAEMCGNGIRCAAIFAKEQNLTDKDKLTFDTLAGLIETEIIDFEKSMVKVNMGKPRLAPHEIPADFPGEKVVNQLLSLGENTYNITLVSMGNPHCVIFVDNVMDYPVEEIGPQIERHSLFPSYTNVEFIELIKENKIRMRVWERGCGETLACGTGACAAVVAASLNGYTEKETEVVLTQGSLFIKWRDNGTVEMTGPADKVFIGEYLE